MGCNEITKLNNLNNLKNLKELYLGNNKIKSVNDNEINNLSKLNILSLQCNHLESIDCKYLPKNIKYLILSENRSLTHIYNIHLMRELVYLDLWRTKITDLKKIEGCEI